MTLSSPQVNPADVALCRRYADLYRMRGLNPLPSAPDGKKPLVRFAHLWETPAGPDLFGRFTTTNVQVMTGRRWRLLVIDLDGPEARQRWAELGRCPRTWTVTSGGNGLHLWFRLPEGYTRPLPKAFLWKGTGKHEAIERLCDQSLVMAPPSVHPVTGQRYRFTSKRESPLGMPVPAMAPDWVLALRPVESTPKLHKPRRDVADLVGSIPHKIDHARSWGVRFTGRRRASGWWECHAFGREDRTPSAAVHEDAGVYVDSGLGTKLSFIDLGIACGAFTDFKDALRVLGVGRAG